jgi:hypothetical protein
LASQSAGTWALRPLADRSILRNSQNSLIVENAAQATDGQTLEQAMDALQNQPMEELFVDTWSSVQLPEPEVPRYSRWFAIYNPYHRAPVHVTHFRDVGERRMAAVSLAMALYRADHAGKWPEQLQDLVRDYLPEVPKDPFRADGRPLGYTILRGALPDGGDRPLISYAEGDVTTGAIDDEPMYHWLRTSNHYLGTRIQYRDLSRWSPKVRRFETEQVEALAYSIKEWAEQLAGAIRAFR